MYTEVLKISEILTQSNTNLLKLHVRFSPYLTANTLHVYYEYQPVKTGGNISSYTENCKGKAVPLQAWSSPEVSKNLRFPDFITTAQDGDKVSLTHRPPLPPGNTPGTRFC